MQAAAGFGEPEFAGSIAGREDQLLSHISNRLEDADPVGFLSLGYGSRVKNRVAVATGNLVWERRIHGYGIGRIGGNGPELTDIGAAGQVQVESQPLVCSPVFWRQGRWLSYRFSFRLAPQSGYNQGRAWWPG